MTELPKPTQPSASQYRALDRRVWILAAVRAVNTMGLSLVMAFMAIYLVTERGISGATYGAIYLVANLFQSASQGYAGALSDRLGRKRIMVWALAVRSVVIAGLGALILVDASVPVIAVVLVVSSSLRGGFEPVAYAVVADIAPGEQRIAAYGIQRMGTNLGWAIGPALGGLLSLSLSYGYIFFCAAPTLLVAAVVIARMTEPSRAAVVVEPADDDEFDDALAEDAEATRTRPAEVVLFLGCALLFAVCHVQLFSTLSIFGKSEIGLSEDEIGLVYMVNGLLVLVTQLPAVALIRRIGPTAALVVGAMFYCGAFLLIGHAGGLIDVAVAIVVLTTGEVLLAPAQQTINADLADPTRYGRAFGVLGLVMMLGVAVAPLLGGAAYDLWRADGPLMWTVLAILPAMLVVGYAVFARMWRAR